MIANVPSFVKHCLVTRQGNELLVNNRLVDPDAEFILAHTDTETNEFIGSFSTTYVLDVTAHCNANCKYCYYKVDNTAPNRSLESIVQEAQFCGYRSICLMGAEPTTREDLPAIISALARRGFQVSITTNGKKLEDPAYLQQLLAAGLAFLNYSMHFTESVKLGRKKLQVVKNLLDAKVQICQFAFTISSLAELQSTLEVIRVLSSLGVRPSQFVIRAGAAIGACTLDSQLFMSDMAKTVLVAGAEKMPRSGSNLYFQEFIFEGTNLHLVRWPDNATVTPYSHTGPVFGTALGPLRSPVFQVVQSLTPVQIANERKLLADNRRIIHAIASDFGSLCVREAPEFPGKAWLHCNIASWGLREMKECLRRWPEFLSAVRAKGFDKVFSAIPANDEKLYKWQERFGMKELSRAQNTIIFVKELGHGSC